MTTIIKRSQILSGYSQKLDFVILGVFTFGLLGALYNLSSLFRSLSKSIELLKLHFLEIWQFSGLSSLLAQPPANSMCKQNLKTKASDLHHMTTTKSSYTRTGLIVMISRTLIPTLSHWGQLHPYLSSLLRITKHSLQSTT